jgi:hypothetical protein
MVERSFSQTRGQTGAAPRGHIRLTSNGTHAFDRWCMIRIARNQDEHIESANGC